MLKTYPYGHRFETANARRVAPGPGRFGWAHICEQCEATPHLDLWETDPREASFEPADEPFRTYQKVPDWALFPEARGVSKDPEKDERQGHA